ncbi:uncharacterized protein LOC107773175 [Nicotiana tabacum]|uniref:Uncharacterized protein LOC107773175 n=1 Tax=Nicotiana tabacum TaxID=4097 RepID=A0AC58U599_TOBAC
MGLVTVTLQCMDYLAWPILALGYPLYVSIRTIETGSKHDLRKLVAYWIIFSFIHLLEQVFEKLVPLWSYIRLVAIFWLVIPQFDGAFYFYQNIILPCLQVKLLDVNLYTITEWFNELKKDSIIKKEKFLSVAERSFEENESEPQAKLTASKISKPECNGDGLALGEIEVMECIAKGDAAELNQVGSMVENVVEIEKKAGSAIEVYEATIRASAEVIKLPETCFIQKFQTRWSCAICQVTNSSEQNLQAHLRGKRHRAEAKLWCNFCSLRCSGEIDMIAHLKGRKHLAKLQESFAAANTGAS